MLDQPRSGGFVWESISRWFHAAAGLQDYRSVHYGLLGLIFVAGASLRFWALGVASLHGDEDIMALAARGVLEHGAPVLPGGQLYTRGFLQVQLIAASMQAFGDTEWAVRLPSAVAGSLCTVLAFFFGRRFLGPLPNLLLAALVAFLPAMIEISKTGRMYVFLVTSLFVFGILLFKWEATGRWRWFSLSLIVWLFAFHFHTLAMLAAPLFLFPGLANRSGRQLAAGSLALLCVPPINHLYRTFRAELYRSNAERPPVYAEFDQGPLDALVQQPLALAAVAVALVSAVFIVLASLSRPADRGRWFTQESAAASLLMLGILACATLHYHLGALGLLMGGLLWIRAGRSLRLPAVLAGLAAIMALSQLAALHSTGEYAGRQILGALVGTPSIWPLIRFVGFTPVGVIAYLLVLCLALARIAKGLPVPVHFLFFAMAVWAPMLVIGYEAWHVPMRYMLGLLPFFLVCLVAGLDYLAKWGMEQLHWQPSRAMQAAAIVAAALVMINPIAALQVARNDHSLHPDHRGAAEFIQSVTSTDPNAILIAEDSIVHTYYLGRVDYRLHNAKRASHVYLDDDGVLRGRYTGTVVLGSGEELLAVMDQASPRTLYVIGNARNSGVRGPLAPRGNGINEVLDSGRLELIFSGRDGGRTQVWRLRQAP